MALQLVELFVKVGSGEPVVERVEHVVGGLAAQTQPRQLTAERATVEQRRPDRADGGERTPRVERHTARRVDHARAEPDGRPVALPDAPHAHHESQASRRGPRLVWVCDDARVAQRRALDGVLTGECRPHQQHSFLRQVCLVVEVIGELTSVPAEGADEVAVALVETDDDLVQRRAHLVLGESKDPIENGSGAGVCVFEAFLPRHEELGDDPRGVSRKPLRASCDEAGQRGNHCRTVDKRRASCCSARSRCASRI